MRRFGSTLTNSNVKLSNTQLFFKIQNLHYVFKFLKMLQLIVY